MGESNEDALNKQEECQNDIDQLSDKSSKDETPSAKEEDTPASVEGMEQPAATQGNERKGGGEEDGAQPSEIQDENPTKGETSEEDEDNTQTSDLEEENAADFEPSKEGEEGESVEVEDEKRERDVKPVNLRDEEAKLLGGTEILFSRSDTKHYNGWDNLRYMAYSGARRLKYFEPVYRFVEQPKSFLAWAAGEQYQERQLAIYEEPSIVLVLKRPENTGQVKEILDSDDANVGDLSAYWIVESVVDPNTCKLRLSPLTTVTSVLEGVQDNEFRRRSCFELITPMAESSIILSAVRIRGGQAAKTSFIDSGAFLETSSAELSLKKCICDAFEKDSNTFRENDSSWKHQIILGTLHSYVILANKSLLDEGIQRARNAQQKQMQSKGGPKSNADVNYLDRRIVDALDESGKTALHYACSSRLTFAVLALVSAGANVDLRVQPNNATPLHICASKLDHTSLNAILAVNRRPNVVDALGRTPMHVAITEGCTVGGKMDSEALDRCMKGLQAHGGELGDLEGFRHPFSDLSLLMNHENLSIVLNHVNHRYPLLVVPNNSGLPLEARMGISASAFYHYPVHSSLIGFRQKVKSACEDNDTQELERFCAEAEGKLVKTLEVLLRAGFEPNERLEGLVDEFLGAEEYANYVGFAPLQILAVSAIDVWQHKKGVGETLVLGIIKLISDVADLLVKNGARLSLEPPQLKRPRNCLHARSGSNHNESSSTIGSDNCCEELNEPLLRSNQLKLDSNELLMELLGGTVKLKAAQEVWKNSGVVILSRNVGSTTIKFHKDKLAIEDSSAPGGSDAKSCAICWKAFGTITNRKHRCRIARRYVCDECSTKRVKSSDGEEHRISDGPFLLVRADEMKASASIRAKQQERKQHNAATSRLEKLEAENHANRDSLFGNVLENMGKSIFGEEDDAAAKANRGMAGLSSQLNQTRDELNQRGERLNSLAEKSDKLVNASADFASMAKELNKSTQGGLFW
mmetsp:Transcript_9210/g.14174  ORF Transcript_9210/g.14174 Transcript_9210/m.14174 type:complete len:979 (-) Transcript_9210:126-3062(-)